MAIEVTWGLIMGADGKPMQCADEWSEWRPIETAPKDGTRILLFSTDARFEYSYVGVGFWADETEDEAEAGWRIPGEFRIPTSVSAECWQPLPPPPASERFVGIVD